MPTKINYQTYLYVLFIYLVAFIIQYNSLLNWDVSLLMHTTERFLTGGQYGIDFFDTDPPLILYVYAIPVRLSEYLHLNFAITNYGFTFFISIGLLVLIALQLRQLPSRDYTINLLLPTIALVFVFVPAMNFAQREHYTCMLIMPYLLATTLQIHHVKTPLFLRWTIGILAAIGFAIKPHFFLPFLLIEGYYFWQLSHFNYIRIESILIVVITSLYLISIFLFQKTYFTLIFPTIIQYYYAGLKELMWPLLVWSHPAFVLSILPVVIYSFLFYRKKTYHLENILALATLGFLAVYILQKTYWYYHLIPAFSLSLLLLIQMGYRYLTLINFNRSKLVTGGIWLAIVLILYYPVKFIYHINLTSYTSKQDGDIPKLIDSLRFFPPRSSIYFFSGCLLPYPAVDYLNFKDVQLAQTYWFMPGIVFNPLSHTIDLPYALKALQTNSVLQHIIDDFIQKNPDIVVADDRINCNGVLFKFLPYFSYNKQFKSKLHQYRLIDHFNTISIYRKN